MADDPITFVNIEIENGRLNGSSQNGDMDAVMMFASELPQEVEDAEGNILHRYTADSVDIVLDRAEDGTISVAQVNGEISVRLIDWDLVDREIEAYGRALHHGESGIVSSAELKGLVEKVLGNEQWADSADEWWQHADEIAHRAGGVANYAQAVRGVLTTDAANKLVEQRLNAKYPSTDVGVPDDGADYGMYSTEGNVQVNELIDEAVDVLVDLVREGECTPAELQQRMDEYISTGMSEIADEHREVSDTSVRESIYQFVRDDAENKHGVKTTIGAYGPTPPTLSDTTAPGAPAPAPAAAKPEVNR